MEPPSPGLDTPFHDTLYLHKTLKRDGHGSILYDKLATRFPEFGLVHRIIPESLPFLFPWEEFL